MNEYKKYLLLLTAALILPLFFIHFDNLASSLGGDTSVYVNLANNLREGNGFSLRTGKPYVPTMAIEPVYPLFLSIFLGKDNNVLVIQLVQALLCGLLSVFMYIILSEVLLSRKRAFIAALIMTAIPFAPSYVPYLFTELFFTFLLAAAVLLLVKGIKKTSSALILFGGIFLGVGTLCRAILMLFPLFLIPFIAVYEFKFNRFKFVSNLIKVSFILLFGYSLVVLPWMIRNKLLFNKFAVSLRGYSTLYNRVNKVNLSNDEIKMYAVYCLSENLANKLYKRNDLVSKGEGYFYVPTKKLNDEIKRIGLTDEEADIRFKEKSLTLIKDKPFKFIALGIFEIIKFNSFGQILLVNHTSSSISIGQSWSLILLRGVAKILGFIILLLAVFGMILSRKNWYNSMIIFAVVLYFNSMHFFLDSVGRYAIPIVPYYMFFGILGFYGAWDTFRIKARMINSTRV